MRLMGGEREAWAQKIDNQMADIELMLEIRREQKKVDKSN